MAWSDQARQASIEARRARAGAHGVSHQVGVGRIGMMDVIRNNPHGFTVDTQGNVPTKGYMVSESGRSQVLSGRVAPHAVSAYAARNADALSQPGSYIGGWRDSKSGKTYLDVSHNIPRQRSAVKAGKERNQIAIWDVKRKREIRTGGTGK